MGRQPRSLSGPVQIDGTATYPDVENGYNQPIHYKARLTHDDDLEIIVLDEPTGSCRLA